jgi:hypothetical protein
MRQGKEAGIKAQDNSTITSFESINDAVCFQMP